MLGVEGFGTAWFDALRVEEVTHLPALPALEPVDGATVTIRRPELRWKPLVSKKQFYRVELSRTAGFTGEVLDAGLAYDRLRPADALAPGRWYWRANRHLAALPGPPSGASSFTVAPDARLWPPRIEPQWGWGEGPRPTVTCRLGALDPAVQLTLTVAGQPARPLPTDGDLHRWSPATDLPAGLHSVVLTATDGTDTLVVRGTLNTQAPTRRVTLDAAGRTLIDGEPFFPLGAYRDPSDSLTDFRGLQEAGFNLTHSYTFEGQATVGQAQAYLRAADAAGLKVFLGYSRNQVRAGDVPGMEAWAAALMNEPGLLCWYLFDEPELQAIPPDGIGQLHGALRRQDPFHPTALLISDPRTYADYAAPCGIFWVDPYPIGRQPLTMVSDRTRAAREAAPGKPVWVVLQAFDWAYWGDAQAKMATDGPPTVPSEAQSRVMAHLALAEGAQGLVWYWQPNSRWHQVTDSPAVWAGLKTVVGELRGALPWLLAPRTLTGELGLPEPLLGWSSEAQGERVLWVINPTDQPVTADLRATIQRARGGPAPATAPAQPVELGALEVQRLAWPASATPWRRARGQGKVRSLVRPCADKKVASGGTTRHVGCLTADTAGVRW